MIRAGLGFVGAVVLANCAIAFFVRADHRLHFIENKGQHPSQVLYEVRLSTGSIFLENNAFTFFQFLPDDLRLIHLHRHDSLLIRGHAWKQVFVGATGPTRIRASGPSAHYYNYFLGNNPAQWATAVREYDEVYYENLYEGIDLRVSSGAGNLKYDFIVHPGADVAKLVLHYYGVHGLSVKNGMLNIHTSIGNFIEQKPYAYQLINGRQRSVSCRWEIAGQQARFRIGSFDRSSPLIIDPTLIFASYTGSTADNFGYTATYDANGAMYLGGLVHSTGYPVTLGAVQTTFGGGNNTVGNAYACDFGIMKLSPMGNALLWATYLGGSSNETPHSLIADANGNLVIYGRTWSNNFPVTASSFDATYNGNGDITVSVLSYDGTQLLGSTYIGGTNSDGVNYDAQPQAKGNLKVNYGDDARGEVMLDAANNILVASCTHSADFPTTAGAFQQTLAGGQDGVVFKLSPDCSMLLWSTFLGGAADDACYSLALRGNDVYVAGGTMSSNFPTTAAALHPTYQGGNMDGFVSHLNSTGTSLNSSTFLGTSGNDQVYFVKLDKNFNVYVFGQTDGTYPVINAAYSNPNSGQFIHKLNSALGATIYSSVFGNGNGKPNISPTAFSVDTCENVYISGWGGSVYSGWPWFSTNMLNMPLTPDALQPTTDGNDFYLAVFRKDFSQLAYATYYGGYGGPDVATEHVDGGTSRFDPNGIIYQAICAGCGGNSLTPATPGAWSETNKSFNCNELGLKIEMNLFVVTAGLMANPTATGCVPLTVHFTNTSVNASQFTWYFGDGSTSNAFEPTYTYTDTGTFQVMLIAYDPLACVPKDTAYTTVIVYNTTVDASYTYTLTDYCDSLRVDVQASSSGPLTTFLWDFGNGNLAYGATAHFTYKEPGLYTVSLIANDPSACNPLDTFAFTVDFTHVVIAELQQTTYYGCPPLTLTFTNTGFGGVSFYWDFGDGHFSTDPNPTHTYQQPGTYYGMFVAHDPNACRPYDTVWFTVTVYDWPPLAAFTVSTAYVTDFVTDIQFINQSQNAVAYLWEFGDGTTSTEVNPTHKYTISGQYLACLTAFNENGCPAKVCTLITVELVPVVDVPNAFSPNGDGANDVLYVKGQDIVSLDFKVFNRWGELVFQTNDVNQGWDGTFRGVAQEMEVYVWMLSARFSNGKSVVKSGNVTLLR
ncbi:MAG: PKD domain-containing protein [Chitinophagales bacterium]|nr:PKD domain-containing protein [Chitinophagales bacterium]MDW8428649.1 PKD domain-containing protein [Chitinophagales bacterium]